MPYQINLYNGTPLVTVEDGTTSNKSTTLTLVGKNYAGYGEIQNENFVYLLENFSGTNSPPSPLKGQIWFDSNNKKLKFWDATSWRTTGGAEVGPTQPDNWTTGDFWFNTATKQLYSWSGSEAILIGPQGVANALQTNFESVSLIGLDGPHPVVEAVIGGEVIAIFSSESFTLDPNSNPNLPKFNYINSGITLVDSTLGTTTTDFRFWGTASDSDKLAGLSASSYVTAANAVFTGLAAFQVDAGLSVGGHDDLLIYLDSNAVPTIKNKTSEKISFQVTVGGTPKEPLRIQGTTGVTGVVPGETNTYNLGTSDLKWKAIYGKSINAEDLTVGDLTVSGSISGTAGKADKLLYSGAKDSTLSHAPLTDKYVSADDGGIGGVNVVGNTIVVRNYDGSFGANVVYATATQARYADLAEKYEADKEYDVGTVVVFGGDKEITVTDVLGDHRVAGVISENPAFLMNDSEETKSFSSVALRGKVPVKVIGQVTKGDILVTSNEKGYAISAGNGDSISAASILARALENKDDNNLGVVIAVIV